MENIKVDKAKLIATLSENRAKHRKIFEEACDGYQKAVIKELEAQLNNAKAGFGGAFISVSLHLLTKPRNMTAPSRC
jgi:hypothetical protein